MGVSGGSNVFRWFSGRLPLTRSTSSRDGKGVVRFASTDDVLTLVYRPNLSVRDVCTEAAIKGNISPVALDFFTLVTEDGNFYLNPNKVLSEAECSQTYLFKLCIKACHGEELREIDRDAFEYYFHQCREEFLRGSVVGFGPNDFARVVIYEIVYCAKQRNVSAKYVIENPNSCGISRLFKRGIFKSYSRKEIKEFLQSEKVQMDKYEKLGVEVMKSEYMRTLERAEDFFVHKLLSFEKIYLIENQISNRKFEVQVSAEFGIKKRRTDTENSLPEDIVKEFSEVEALEFDSIKNQLTIIRENSKPEILTASSSQVAHSLITLIEGYYCLMINQYKRLLRGPRRVENFLYHGPISREKAENLLEKGSREDGTFLLRKRRKAYSSYVLSLFHAKEVKHYIIDQDSSVQPPIFHLESEQTKGFSTLQGLIEHYKQSPHGLPVCLTTICPPKTEGLAALLDRELLTPAPPEFQLVDDGVRISLDDLVIEPRALSKGEFGELRKGSWWCSRVREPLFVVSRALVKPTGREKLLEYRKAMSTFLELKNQHLILCHGIVDYQKTLLFVFEFANEGPLDVYIRKESGKKSAITKGRVVSYAAQIAEGMMFLHSKECVHGRLSAHNVLVASDDCVKISDAGLLDLVKNKQSFYASEKGNRFSYCWFSPESLQSDSFNKKSDVWSFGVTLWEMFVMKKPFHFNLVDGVLTTEEIFSRYLKGQYLDPDRPNVPVKVQALIKRCCSPDPQARPDFQELVVNLRSPELVPEKEAAGVLLLPDINELEDWETPILPRENELKLLKHRADSEASDADYSCLPGNPLHDDTGSCNDTVKLPGFTYMSNSTSFNNTILRKESLSKTFSHPGLVINDNLPLRNPVNALSPRKVSITRASSCPPAIEATTEEPPQPYELRTIESGKRQREVTFIQPPTSSSRGSTDEKLLYAPQLAQLEKEVLDDRPESSVDGSVKEFCDTGGDTSSSDDDNEQHTTEAMAMQCLGGFVKGTVMLPPSYADDVLNGTHESNMADSNDHLSELSENMTARHMGVSEIPPPDSVGHAMKASFSQSNEVALLADNLRKLSSGSYVTLSMLSQRILPSDDQFEHAEAEEHPSVVPSAADDSLALDVSPYRNLGTTEITKASSSSSASSSSHDMECSPNQGDTGLNHGSPRFHCTSSDALLGSFSNLHPPNEVQTMDLTQFLRDTDGSSVREESSPVITDLQDSSENEDASSRDDAESSLGTIFHSGFNRMAKDNNGDGALDLCLHSFTHLGFGIDPPEQQEVVLEHDSPSYQTTPSHTELDKSTLFMGVAGREHVDKDDHVSGKYFPDESQTTSCMPCFDELFSTIEPDNSTSTLPTNECGTSVLEHTAGALDEDEHCEAHETVGDTLDLPCGPMRFSPETVDFLNLFEHGLENFEMKEFPLNNLSKAHESRELLFFKENQSVCLGMSSNQLDDTLSEGGLSQDNDQEGDEVIEENLLPVSSPYSIKADVDERLQEITSTTPEVPSEPQASSKRLVDRGYCPPPPPPKEEPETSLNWSSSDGYWPNGETVDGLVRKKSTTGSSSTCSETSTLKLDMSKIPSRLKIPFEHLQILEFLGQGQFGEVRRGRMVYTDSCKKHKREDVAVKVLKANASEQSSSDFVKEVENMVELACRPQCKYIIKLRGVCIDSGDKLMLVTELASQGALRNYLPKNKDILGKSQLLEFCKQICEGMEYLEKHSLLHRDLAARNILVMTEDVVKISDFGLSRLQDYYKIQNIEDRLLPIKWYALESLMAKRFTTKSDVWSFGVTMWEIFSYGGDPYHDIKSEELYPFLESGKRLSCPEKCPRDIYQVMQKCWITDPADRPTFYYLKTEHLAKCSVEQ